MSSHKGCLCLVTAGLDMMQLWDHKFNLHPLLWFVLKAKSHQVYSFNYFRYSLSSHTKITNLFMKAILRCALPSSIKLRKHFLKMVLYDFLQGQNVVSPYLFIRKTKDFTFYSE